MRKLFICTLIASLAFASEASYLYWQVNLADSGISKEDSTYYFNGNAIGGFRIAASTSPTDYYANTTVAANSTGYDNGTAYTSFGNIYATPGNVTGNDILISELNTAYSAETYTYYVEILGSDTSTVIGYGTEGLTYGDALSSGRLVSSLSDISIAPLAAWTGGSYAVPEPTSGLLLLVGGALLALRRRRV